MLRGTLLARAVQIAMFNYDGRVLGFYCVDLSVPTPFFALNKFSICYSQGTRPENALKLPKWNYTIVEGKCPEKFSMLTDYRVNQEQSISVADYGVNQEKSIFIKQSYKQKRNHAMNQQTFLCQQEEKKSKMMEAAKNECYARQWCYCI